MGCVHKLKYLERVFVNEGPPNERFRWQELPPSECPGALVKSRFWLPSFLSGQDSADRPAQELRICTDTRKPESSVFKLCYDDP